MTLTPAMQQYYDIKNQHTDAILFFRMGDFYEMFDEDAKIAHKILGITLTTRNKNSDKAHELAGIPYHARDKYLPVLINAGYKVAIAEQVSSPKAKGIVDRKVVRIITPSTLHLEGEQFEQKESQNIIASLVSGKKENFGFSFFDISKNIWKVAEFETLTELGNNLYKISPSELILEQELFSDNDLREILEKKYGLTLYFFSPKEKYTRVLEEHFGVKGFTAFGLNGQVLALRSSGLLLEYMQAHQKATTELMKNLSFESFSEYMELDEATVKSLDLVYNFATQSSKEGTLLGILDKTKTSGGFRFLRDAILHPLQDVKEIKKRQAFIQAFLENQPLLKEVRDELKYVSDIEAIMNRLTLNRANSRDLLSLKRSLQAVVSVQKLVKEKGGEKLQKLL